MINPHSKYIRIHQYILFIIFFLSFLTALLQGIPSLSRIPRDFIRLGCFVLFLPVPVLLFILHKKGKLSEDAIALAIIFAGMLFRCSYVLLSGLYDRQHDEGVYTGIATSQVNPGHIGYIEYIYKFRRLPDFNPYQLFSYYHPPLHYVISGLWLILLTTLGMPEDLAFENLQILPLSYSGLFMLLTYLVLKKTGAKNHGLFAGLSLAAFHPALTIMSGSINNDMLSTLLLACLKNLLFIALFIGLGMLCKINAVIIALPVGLIFLLDFISSIRTRDKRIIYCSVRNYTLFGITSGAIGLSWIIRNLILFHVKPGISSATEASVMYTGHYGIWDRIGLPALADWHFSFPFHPLSGDVIHNIWVIMFQTSLFTETYPQELSGFPLFLCRLVYPLAILTATASAILFLAAQYKKMVPKNTPAQSLTDRTAGIEAIFLSTGYFSFLFSFVAFSLKYPYTCSSDFRYIAICLLYIAVGLADGHKLYTGRTRPSVPSRIIRACTGLTLLLTTLVYLTWDQW